MLSDSSTSCKTFSVSFAYAIFFVVRARFIYTAFAGNLHYYPIVLSYGSEKKCFSKKKYESNIYLKKNSLPEITNLWYLEPEMSQVQYLTETAPSPE